MPGTVQPSNNFLYVLFPPIFMHFNLWISWPPTQDIFTLNFMHISNKLIIYLISWPIESRKRLPLKSYLYILTTQVIPNTVTQIEATFAKSHNNNSKYYFSISAPVCYMKTSILPSSNFLPNPSESPGGISI